MSRNNTNSSATGGGVDKFIQLTDTPNTYSGTNSGDYVVVNGTTNGLIFSPTPPTGVSEFIELSDVQAPYSGSGKYVIINNSNNGLAYQTLPPIPVTFPNLADVPPYSGANKYVVVNPTNNGVDYITPPPIPSIFPDLSDVPPYTGANKYVVVNPTNNGIEYINPPIFPPFPNLIFDGGFLDVPNNTGAANQTLKSDGLDAVWEYQKFVDLVDVSSDFFGQANKVVVVDPTETFLTYTSQTVPTSFISLTDTPNNYVGDADKFVKVRNDETGLHFVTGGSAAIGLLDLDDNTGSVNYSVDQIGITPQVNVAADGWLIDTTFSNLKNQTYTPRLVQGFVQTYKNPQNKPTFAYDSSDMIEPNATTFFGTYRTNYNDSGTPFLNDFWTTKNDTGGSNMYTNVSSSLDIYPAFVGIGSKHHSCGAIYNIFALFNTGEPPSPYNTWVADVEYTFNAQFSISNIDDNIFLLYICTKEQLATISGGNATQKAQRADYFYNQGNGEVSISCSKIITVDASKLGANNNNTVNAYMKVVKQGDLEPKASFTVGMYHYINVSTKILSIRPSNVQKTLETGGIFW